MTKIVFLDMDGVVNSHEFWTRRKKLGDKRDLYENNIDPLAVARLNKLVERFPDVRFVMSSTWRKFKTCDEIQKMLDDRGFIGKIIDRTVDLWAHPELVPDDYRPRFSLSQPFERGHEIRHWLVQNMKKLGVESYVILDDGADMATVQDKHVLCDQFVGFSDEDVDRAIEILERKRDG